MISEIRSKRVMKRIAELLAIGMNPEDIKNAVKEEFKIDASKDTIARVIKSYSVRKKEILHQDEKFKELYKEIIFDLINKVKDNLKLLEYSRKIVFSKLREAEGLPEQSIEVTRLERYTEEIKNTKDWAVVHNKVKDILKVIKAPNFIANLKLVTYIREVNSSIKTQNDSVKTMNELLKRLEVETKETKVSAIKSVQLSLETLKELEKLGMIEIKKDYYIEIQGKKPKEDKEKEVKNESKKTRIQANESDTRTDKTEKTSA